MTRQAVAYIRRSSGHERPLSLQAQTAAVTTAAEMRGDTIARTYKDWGRSGGADHEDIETKRPEFMSMLGAVSAGAVAAVYCYDADRLSRNESILHRLLDAAGRTETAVVDRLGRDLAGREYRLAAGVPASVDAQMLRDITERNRANRDEKVRRGDDLGEAPYGWTKLKLTEPGVNSRGDPAEAGACVNVRTDPDAILTVLNAYAAAGSALGAAALLNAIGHPTKRGRTWNNRGVREVVEREAPELLPARMGRKHARHYRTRILSGVLRCRCGTIMSPNGDGWTCAMGTRGAHEKPYNVQDTIVLPWVRAEADRLSIAVDSIEDAADEGRREAIEAKRQKLIDLYLDDAISRADMDAKMKDLDTRIVALEARAGVHDVPRRIDWEGWSPPVINEVLRSLFTVELGEDMRPVRAVWIVPEWRAERAKARRPRRRGRLDAIRLRVKRA